MKEFPYEHISVLIMPTDYCNMNCVYCFNSRKTTEKRIMSEETLRKIFEITIPFYREINYIWHGGEPLSMGIDFYKKALSIQKELNVYGNKIKNSIQTNLTLLDAEMADFVVANDIHIGSSFDGTQNEKTRHNSKKIVAGSDLLREHGGRNGFICVLQNYNIEHLIEDYEWFKSKKINYTINPYLVSPLEMKDNPLFVSAEKYVYCVSQFFDYWIKDTSCNIRISYFVDFINYILFKSKSLCCYNSCIGKHIGVHFDGKIYNCNRDFPEQYCFGNVYDYKDIHECFESKGFELLLQHAIERRNKCRNNCDIYEFCAGGCNSCALVGGDICKNNEYTCAILKGVYAHVKEVIERYCELDNTILSNEVNPHVVKKIFEYKEVIPK